MLDGSVFCESNYISIGKKSRFFDWFINWCIGLVIFIIEVI